MFSLSNYLWVGKPGSRAQWMYFRCLAMDHHSINWTWPRCPHGFDLSTLSWQAMVALWHANTQTRSAATAYRNWMRNKPTSSGSWNLQLSKMFRKFVHRFEKIVAAAPFSNMFKYARTRTQTHADTRTHTHTHAHTHTPKMRPMIDKIRLKMTIIVLKRNLPPLPVPLLLRFFFLLLVS